MMKRKMMLEIDHMSVKAAGQALRHPRVRVATRACISSHSWMDLNWTERVYKLGGFIAQYMHGSEEFSAEAEAHGRAARQVRRRLRLRHRHERRRRPARPRGARHPEPGDATPSAAPTAARVIDKQTTGQRTWDLNTDGAAHYGLVPDWIEDIRLVGGQDVVDDLFRGAESYLDTWGASEKHKAGVNLAAGAAASASSSEWNPFTSYAPGRAVDGDTGTRWASDWSDDQWLAGRPRQRRTVVRVTLDWESAHAKAYRVEVSTDGTNWRTAWSTDAGDGGVDTRRSADHRPLRPRPRLQRATHWGYSLHEVGVYDR